MIALVEGANRQKTPNEIALNILLAALTIIFLAATATMQPMAIFAKAQAPGVADSLALDSSGVTAIVLVSLVVCLIPTTIGALLSAIGIAGMDRLVQRNVLAMSGRAVEAAGDVNTLLLDKTGTITLGNRHATEVLPLEVPHAVLAEAAQLSSLADPTPEGRSIVEFTVTSCGQPARSATDVPSAEWVEFTAQTRMSGVDLPDRQIRKGAAGSVLAWVRERGGRPPLEIDQVVDEIARSGGTPLVVAEHRGSGGAGTRRAAPGGRRQTRHAGALRHDARDGHPHRDDHRRQPADRAGDRRRGRASTTSSPRRPRRTSSR